MTYRVGDVVCCDYCDFEGEKRVGIFVIVYNEQYDRKYTGGHSNITVAKITTNNFVGNSYTVPLRKGDAGLDSSCLINLSKLHTFKQEQAYKLIGRLNKQQMTSLFKEYRKFLNESLDQILERC